MSQDPDDFARGARQAREHLRAVPPTPDSLRAELDGAPPVGDAPPAPPPAPPDGKRRRRPGEIFPGAPVQALGVEGALFWYLDILGQVQAVDTHTRDRMRGLFGGREDLLRGHFPRTSKDGDVIGWEQEKAASAMQRACAERGVWSPRERVRGPGAWRDDEGRLVLHAGDAVMIEGEWRPPGVHGRHVYPARRPVPRPDPGAPVAEAGGRLLDWFARWEWQREDVDAVLLLGWLAAAMVGGALPWRPLIWITGGPGTGKSELQRLIDHTLGDGGLMQSADATEAGIRATVGDGTLPVALDEIEPDQDSRAKVKRVITLARLAGSGAVVLRGTQTHGAAEFRVQSCFLFSSILVPPMLDQDISRMAILELDPLPVGVEKIKLERAEFARLGAALRQRLVEHWHRLDDTLHAYAMALAATGHNSRGCDQFGTLLAMADLAMHDDAPGPERARMWAESLSARVIQDQMDQQQDWQRLATHLLGQQVEAWRGGRRPTVGWLMRRAAKMLDDEDSSITPKDAAEQLESLGLRIRGVKDAARVFVANAHPGLSALLRDTHWHAEGGQSGAWGRSLRRVPGARPSSSGTRFGGRAVRYVDVPLSELLGLDEEDVA